MATTADFRNGMTFRMESELWKILEFQHVKPGKGGAFVRTKLRRLSDGAVIEKTFRAGEKIDEIRIVARQMQYLYESNDLYYFMDEETFEQQPLNRELLDDVIPYLKENMVVKVLWHEEQPLWIEVPQFIELEVVKTDPGVRGDTATGGSKPAELETGLSVQVPLFINEGELIKIDTTTGEYLTRV
ncbi:elongation factor P [Candidatus Zixiibacteriota bacterium]